MKQKFILCIAMLAAVAPVAAHCATPWWQQPTICRLNPANCYVGMGAGYDSGMWDAESGCWGMKLICPDATTAADSEPVAMGRTEIASGVGINRDYDTGVLNGDCFGMRKTTANGSMASVDGKFVNVWCTGVLSNPDETVASGEITLGAQPTCAELARDGYAGVLNGRCYGKFYNLSEYYIECGAASDTAPSRLIVLNGADYENAAPGAPTTAADAKTKFDQMESVSKTHREKYFEKK